jgi:hypothetical protein
MGLLDAFAELDDKTDFDELAREGLFGVGRR